MTTTPVNSYHVCNCYYIKEKKLKNIWCIMGLFIKYWFQKKKYKHHWIQYLLILPSGLSSTHEHRQLGLGSRDWKFFILVKYCCPPGKAVGCIVISWLGNITTLKPHNLLPHPVRTPERSNRSEHSRAAAFILSRTTNTDNFIIHSCIFIQIPHFVLLCTGWLRILSLVEGDDLSMLCLVKRSK